MSEVYGSDQSDDVIALRLLTGAGSEHMALLIGRPRPHPDGWDWLCDIAILGPDGREFHTCAQGTDSLSALITALGVVKAFATKLAGHSLGWHREGELGLDYEIRSRTSR